MLRSVLRTPSARVVYSRPQLYASRHLARTLVTHALRPSPAEAIRKTYHAFQAAEAKRPIVLAGACIIGTRTFHTSRRNQSLPILPLLAGLLKTSSMLEIVRTAARIALTFVPVILIKNHKTKRKLRAAEASGDLELAEKVRTIRHRTVFFHVLLFIPVFIFWATILASLERTPLTGRWRLILLSPEEEEDISSQLAGPGWYQAVGEILSRDGTAPQLIPPSDWRLSWVKDTLRRLESVIPLLQHESALEAKWLECGPDDIPLPPPADFPLNPRPRASEYVRRFAELTCGRTSAPAPHGIPGPPYALIVVDKSDSSNAFSYGFGPDGGGGIVVFSGFLDDIMEKYPSIYDDTPPVPKSSWWSSLFSGLFPVAPTQPPHPMPTEEQTSELAILLAHELSHLILSHHLETLSSGSIIWPGILSITTDIIRAVLFPVTMLFGPFVNDALAGLGKYGSGEFTKLTEYCTSQKQEVEADIVSARLLAHAGFDPRHAVRFWEGRHESERTAECSPAQALEHTAHDQWAKESTTMRWMGQSHPMHIVRVERLKEELQRWKTQRELLRELAQVSE